MSDCKEISELFLACCDGEADEPSETSLHTHLTDCPTCSEDFRLYRFAVQSLGSLEPVAPPPDFLAQVNARLDDLHSPSLLDQIKDYLSSVPYIPLPVGLVAILFLAALGFSVYKQTLIDIVPGFASDKPLATTHGGGAGGIQGSKGIGSGAAYTAEAVSSPLAGPSSPPSHVSVPFSTNPHSVPLEMTAAPTIADRIGADNLTVESPRIDAAVQSVKRLVPDLNGKIVNEDATTRAKEKVLGVMIPSRAYGDLTTELINHGAVEAGAGTGVHPPQKLEGGHDSSVLLHIRFIPSR